MSSTIRSNDLPADMPEDMRRQIRDAIKALETPDLGAEVGKHLKRKNKYNAKRTVCDGILFDSKKEARRYEDLKRLRDAGEVRWFSRQGVFDLPGGIAYRIDFTICWKDGTVTHEDVKGYKTKTYRLKKRQVQAIHHVEIVEA